MVDRMVASALAALALASVWLIEPGQEPRPTVTVIALVMTGSLAWRRRAPTAVLTAVLIALLALATVAHTVSPMYALLATIIAVHAVGAYGPWRIGLVGIGVTAVVLWLGLWMDPTRHEFFDYPFALMLAAGSWGFGAALRSRERRAIRLQEQGEQLARQAVLEERARIARELHDVIAHSVSVMVVQTGLVRRRISRERPDEAHLLGEVEQIGRLALDEMRRLLGLLRADGEELALSPQPGLATLAGLVEQMRASGVPVELTVTGDQGPLPPGLDLAAYRIVQEALTNVLKHGAGSAAHVAIDHGRGQLTIGVTNTPPHQEGPSPHVGHGMVGMRERAALYGGTFEAGRRPDGTFSIRATLPVERERLVHVTGNEVSQ
ncbi:sensor histidine kinase [Micromonospora inositola]|nr:histidine kinase [Micromonospora inositola]